MIPIIPVPWPGFKSTQEGILQTERVESCMSVLFSNTRERGLLHVPTASSTDESRDFHLHLDDFFEVIEETFARGTQGLVFGGWNGESEGLLHHLKLCGLHTGIEIQETSDLLGNDNLSRDIFSLPNGLVIVRSYTLLRNTYGASSRRYAVTTYYQL
ncbi:hypothetical protein J4410_01855 [Candidatus Woesearchaeota archaeon]|nr:hypothetical protein [Candidatus Woesearchaeota archaeon]